MIDKDKLDLIINSFTANEHHVETLVAELGVCCNEIVWKGFEDDFDPVIDKWIDTPEKAQKIIDFASSHLIMGLLTGIKYAHMYGIPVELRETTKE